MRESDLDLLRCTSCDREKLALKGLERADDGRVLTGELSCDCGAIYPIRGGVPDFVGGENYSDSFGVQWKRWPRVQFESENVGTKMEGATSERFFKITGMDPEWLKGRTVLEVGCGPGRFLDVIESHGGRAVGLDFSEAAYVAADNLAGRNVFIVRGDALNPPFREGVFDGAYAIGVLHHTPDPELATEKMVRRVKPGGRVACHVYPAYNEIRIRQTAFYRKLFGILGPKVLLAYSYFSASVVYYLGRIPIFGPALKLFLPVKTVRSFRWRQLNIYDWLSPTYMSYHTTREVFDWFKRVGCTDIEPTEQSPTSFTAKVN